MSSVNSLLLKTDRFCDYIPVLSTVTNLVVLFQKCVVLPFLSEEKIGANHYYKHLNAKSFVRCLLLVIPVLGNIVVGIYDFSKKKPGASPPAITQDSSLEAIVKLSNEEMERLCLSLRWETREDYIKSMLICALWGDKQLEKYSARSSKDNQEIFESAFRFVHIYDGNRPNQFILDDITVGQENKGDTLLHAILKGKELSAKAKGAAFRFILRVAGQGDRIILSESSLKTIFDAFTSQDKTDFIASCDESTICCLGLVTGIVKA